MIINIVQFIFSVFALLFGGSEGVFASIVTSITNIMINLFVMGLMWLWTKVGVLLVMKSSRDSEYDADKFSLDLGYGHELCALLDTNDCSGGKGLFANLASSHPDKSDRIAKLQQLGSTYRKEYAQ